MGIRRTCGVRQGMQDVMEPVQDQVILNMVTSNEEGLIRITCGISGAV